MDGISQGARDGDATMPMGGMSQGARDGDVTMHRDGQANICSCNIGTSTNHGGRMSQ